MSATMVKRFEDMSPTGQLRLFRQADGDVIVELISNEEGDFQRLCVEFCTPMIGGGQSPHTHRALVQLISAMELDEKENAQRRSR